MAICVFFCRKQLWSGEARDHYASVTSDRKWALKIGPVIAHNIKENKCSRWFDVTNLSMIVTIRVACTEQLGHQQLLPGMYTSDLCRSACHTT